MWRQLKSCKLLPQNIADVWYCSWPTFQPNREFWMGRDIAIHILQEVCRNSDVWTSCSTLSHFRMWGKRAFMQMASKYQKWTPGSSKMTRNESYRTLAPILGLRWYQEFDANSSILHQPRTPNVQITFYIKWFAELHKESETFKRHPHDGSKDEQFQQISTVFSH